MIKIEIIYLKINLSKNTHSNIEIPKVIAKEFLGGRGLASFMLYSSIIEDKKLFFKKNPLIFSCGALIGLPIKIPGISRFTISFISPLTGILGDSNTGGLIGVGLKELGYSGLIIENSFKKPHLLVIGKNNVSFIPAMDYWGLKVNDGIEKLKASYPNYYISIIGPAGENLVPFATIINEPNRFAGRCGSGCVMGSKKIKAILVQKQLKKNPENNDNSNKMQKIKDLIKLGYERSKDPGFFPFKKWGTGILVKFLYYLKRIPAKYWSTTEINHINNISPPESFNQLLKYSYHKNFPCDNLSGCFLNCSSYFKTPNGDIIRGPEYEAIGNIGGQCYIASYDDIIELYHFCNQLGLDVITTFNIIAFIIRLKELGIINQFESLNNTEFQNLSWGNKKIFKNIIRIISNGNSLLSKGVRKIAETKGKKAKDIAIHVKGLEIEASVLKNSIGALLSHMVSSRGGDHNRGMPSPHFDNNKFKNKDSLVIKTENYNVLIDSLGICRFYSTYGRTINIYDLKNALNLFYNLYEIDYSSSMLTKSEWNRIGNNIITIERLLNINVGLTSLDDLPPVKFINEVDYNKLKNLLKDYYLGRGWTNTGIPKKDFLKEMFELDEIEIKF